MLNPNSKPRPVSRKTVTASQPRIHRRYNNQTGTKVQKRLERFCDVYTNLSWFMSIPCQRLLPNSTGPEFLKRVENKLTSSRRVDWQLRFDISNRDPDPKNRKKNLVTEVRTGSKFGWGCGLTAGWDDTQKTTHTHSLSLSLSTGSCVSSFRHDY